MTPQSEPAPCDGLTLGQWCAVMLGAVALMLALMALDRLLGW